MNQIELKQLLWYDKHTGIFRWRISANKRSKPWDVAGSTFKDGYIYIRINGKAYLAHRLAWLYINGMLPEKYIDHIDGTKNNNCIENLRLATNKQNQENQKQNITNTTGFRGVTFHKKSGKYQAQVCHNKKLIYCGLFDTIDLAASAAKEFRAFAFTHDEGRAK